MKKYLNYILLFGVLLIIFSGCEVSNSASVNNQNYVIAQPTVIGNESTKSILSTNNNKINSENHDEGNEITACAPQKIYRGETLKISFRENHGGHLAVYTENRKKFYFIESQNLDREYPQITEAEFKKIKEIELDTGTTRKTDFVKSDSAGNFIVDRVFEKTGWYNVIVGHQGLDVDFADMPVTGSCRVYFVNKKRP